MESFDLREWLSSKDHALSEPFFIDHVSIDSRRIISTDTLFIALQGNRHDGHDFIKDVHAAGAKAAIVTNTFDTTTAPKGMQLFACDTPLRALQEIAALYRKKQKAKVIAVTGSYGKTMLKDLLVHITESTYCVVASPESFNSQIGVALSLLRIEK